jgi:hypothetical protein
MRGSEFTLNGGLNLALENEIILKEDFQLVSSIAKEVIERRVKEEGLAFLEQLAQVGILCFEEELRGRLEKEVKWEASRIDKFFEYIKSIE